MATLRLMLCALVALLTAGCGGATHDGSPRPSARNSATYGPNVVHPGGIQDIEFGVTMSELRGRGRIGDEAGACGPPLTGLPNASPIFADNRLVLVWAYPPLRTPEGVGVGSPLSSVHAAYPDLVELSAPEGTYRFDALMKITGDRAYLFLHDGHTVQKLVVGFREYAQRLFDSGFGTC